MKIPPPQKNIFIYFIFFYFFFFFFFLGGGGGGGVRSRRDVRGGSQGGCEQRIEVFVKNKKIYIFFGGGGDWGLGRVGGQGGCERRIEVFVKIKKKKNGGVRGVGLGKICKIATSNFKIFKGQ